MCLRRSDRLFGAGHKSLSCLDEPSNSQSLQGGGASPAPKSHTWFHPLWEWVAVPTIDGVSFPTRSLDPYVSQHEEHQRLEWVGQMDLTVLLDAVATGDQLTVVECRAGRGDASPVHVHTHDDEAFLLLEGAMTVWVGESRIELRAGGIGFLPKNIPHAFRFDTPSRALILSTPAGQEKFFRAAGWDMSEPKPDGWSISVDTLQEAAAAYGTRIVGPPHGLED